MGSPIGCKGEGAALFSHEMARTRTLKDEVLSAISVSRRLEEMIPPYDTLIVGAGPAGCAAAYDLARAGKRVLLLDKRSFPRHKACACGLTRKTMEALRYSVEPVVERVCKEIVLQIAERPGAGALADKGREVRVKTRNPICAMAVRETFDDFCLKQTLAQGAELRKIEGIVALREVDGGVELDVALSDGSVETLKAPVVIGADGSNGQMRRLEAMLADGGEAQAAKIAEEPEWYARGFALEAMVPYTALPAKLPEGDGPLDLVFDFSPIVGGYGWLFPKGDHINIGVGGFVPRTDNTANNDRPHEKVTRALLNQYTMQKLGIDLAGIGAHVTGQYLGLGGHAYVPHGRVLLVGDAAGLVDPLTGEGIHSALVSGQAAAAALLEGGDVAAAYARQLATLKETLAFSHRAARSFYATPERGFKVMRTPILRNLVLKTYADGLPHTKLLARLAKAVT
jgi:geranylgeranyl reductase family protein